MASWPFLMHGECKESARNVNNKINGYTFPFVIGNVQGLKKACVFKLFNFVKRTLVTSVEAQLQYCG